MSKGRNTIVISARVTDDVYAMVKVRADKKGQTISEYLNSCIRYILKQAESR